MIQPNIRGSICHASVRYACANNKLIGWLDDPRQPTLYINEMDANNIYGLAMSQNMPDDDCKWLSEDECRDMKMVSNYVDGLISIFDTGLFDHWEKEKNKKFYFEMDFQYLPELHECDHDYPLAQTILIIVLEIIGKKQHNLRGQYFGAACPYSRKLIFSVFTQNTQQC